MSAKGKPKKRRDAIPDLHVLQARRELGNYRALARLLPAGLEKRDSFDEKTVLVRTIAAEVVAHNGDIDQMEKMLAPYIKNVKQVPLSAAARVLLTTALLLFRRHENESALRQLGRARSIAAAYKDEHLIAETIQCEAEIAASRGLLEEAVESFQSAIARYSIQERPYRVGLCYLGCGRALVRLGKIEETRWLIEAAVRLLTDSADDLSLACARMSFAEVVTVFGEYGPALEQLESAGSTFEQLGNPDQKLLAEAAIIEILIRLNCVDPAAERIKQATLPASDTSSKGLIKFHQAEARVYAALGRWRQAEESALQAVEISKRSDDPLGRAETRCTLGEIYLAVWLDADAVSEFRAAAIYARQAQHSLLELKIKLFLSEALHQINKAESDRLLGEVERAIAGRDLSQLQEAFDRARKRNGAQELEHFYVLTGEGPLNVKEGNRRLIGWIVSRVLQLSGGSISDAARVLKTSPNYVQILVKRLRRGVSVSKRRTNQ